MPTERFFRREPDVIWVPHLHAFVHTRRQLGVDRDIVEDDLQTAIETGDVPDDDPGIAAFGTENFDLAASVFPVALDARGHWQRVEEYHCCEHMGGRQRAIPGPTPRSSSCSPPLCSRASAD